mgnify:CR=1 FL=1
MNRLEESFVEKVGLLLEADGAPRISGKILGRLLLSATPRSLDELAEELLVSKASVSTNARLLEDWGALERVSHPGDRRDYYRIAPDAEARMLSRRIERMRKLIDLLAEGEQVAQHDAAVHARVRRLKTFYEHAVQSLEEAIEHLRTCQVHVETDDEFKQAGVEQA